VHDLVGLLPRPLGGPADQLEQPLVRVGLAEQVDRLPGEDLASDVAAVLLGQVVPKAREDDAVQTPILRRLKGRRAATDEPFMRPSQLSHARALRARPGSGRWLVLLSLGVAAVVGGFVLDAGRLDWGLFAAGASLLAAAAISRLVALLRAFQDMYEQARASERRFRMVFESAGVGISLGEDGMMTETNEAFQNFLGYTADELSGKHFTEVTHPDDSDLEVEANRELRAGERPSFTIERRYVRSDGEIVWARVTITRSRDGSFGIAVIEDITERHELEERLRQSQKMEAVGQLAGGVAHDFNNLLTAINGYAELAVRNGGDRPALRDNLRAIQDTTDRAASLTHQLLAFSRRQRLKPKVVDLNDVVAGSLGLVERLIREDVSVETSFASGVPHVRADPDQLTHVLLNLAVNARDAMPSGGTLRISSEAVVLDEADGQRLWGAPPGPYVRLSVEDTGVGMEPAVLERVFEPFFTTKEVGAGTGLGLSTAYGVVKQSGGYITAESDPGLGSRFDVYLPATSEPIVAVERPVEPALPRGAARILVVEDEEVVCRLIAESLTAAGYEVTATADPRSALDLARETRFDVLVTDVTMPHMNGPEVARALLERRPDLRVLYTSGHGAAAPVGLVGEGAAFLPKPFGLFELQSRVATLLEERAA
jgi:two-component system, cell cycle sensor histidine kinase and response regulator CckA